MSKKIDIISLYLDDYKKHLSGREIARILKINPQTALNHLNGLVDKKIIIFEKKGKNKEYIINLTSQKARILLEIAEECSSLKKLDKKEISLLIKEILPFAESVVLFGSFAKDREKSDSDIDLVIAGKADKEEIGKIKKRHPRQVNIEYISYKDFASSLKKKKALALEILNAHIIFGNVSKIVDIYFQWYKR
ncbi:hypothetical protein GF323_01505 [Candidatus Woesearchaeota archaeon]|nr:hypothetical protein [Candidatus Woesearchaeota archaeon]